MADLPDDSSNSAGGFLGPRDARRSSILEKLNQGLKAASRDGPAAACILH